MDKTAVIAIGGNSLIKDKEHQSVPDQFASTDETCLHIAEIMKEGWKVVITHGNGPQVGFILLRSELASNVLHTVPLDSCGADTQGALGYMIQQLLGNRLRKVELDTPVLTVVTQVVVDAEDPAFQNPTKPIGPFYDEDRAHRYQRERGWTIIDDAGRGWRRVVPSPIPREIVELEAIRTLVQAGFVVVGVGGGGIPVVRDERGDLHGVEAVIDKDYASSLLAADLGVDLFLISTAVEKVYLNYGQPQQTAVDHMTVAQAKDYLEKGHFPPGSMGPKIIAVIDFLERGGKEALITSPENLARALRGETGTRITLR
ncbi:MAG TPA: carbamate kinase [Chloroflexi bacterium]|nr:carbamate kinase [Chloroflexota bacterium]